MGECVLVVDDHPPMVKLIVDALEKAGYLALSAQNGAEGLRVASAHRPDLMILDVEMPVMNGFEVLRALRLKVATGTLPVIMLTVHKDPQDLLAGSMGGADQYLTKPCRIEEVVAAVKRALAPPDHQPAGLPLPFPSPAESTAR